MEIDGHEEITGEEIDHACDTREEDTRTLSDKINWFVNEPTNPQWADINVNDVREFIRLLKSNFTDKFGVVYPKSVIVERIDKLAGEKLI